jgi:hypothetical protein
MPLRITEMAYDAKVLEVIIASPSDVEMERAIVREVVLDWNAVHARERKAVLLATGWETHSSPELGARPQQLINNRLLVHADLLIGIFWTRVGSPTGKAVSGSIEEIEEHRRRGKPVMLYFSSVPVIPDSVDQAQYAELTKFKEWAHGAGLVEAFSSREEFRTKFQRQLQLTLRDNPYLKGLLTVSPGIHRDIAGNGGAGRRGITISDDARELLSAAGATKDGSIFVHRAVGGTTIHAGQQTFGEENARSAARWEAALDELRGQRLVRDHPNGRGIAFELTDAGYRLVQPAGA